MGHSDLETTEALHRCPNVDRVAFKARWMNCKELDEVFMSIRIRRCDNKHRKAQLYGSKGILACCIGQLNGGLYGLENGVPQLMGIN